MSSSKIRKKKRERLVSMLFFLPNSRKLAADRWLRGRKEFKEIRKADYVIISPPKAGRTWLRVMLSNAYQLHYGLPGKELLGFGGRIYEVIRDFILVVLKVEITPRDKKCGKYYKKNAEENQGVLIF